MAAIRLVPSLPTSFKTTSLSSSSSPKFPCLLHSHSRKIPLVSSSSSLSTSSKRLFSTLQALVNGESVVADQEIDSEASSDESDEDIGGFKLKKQTTPCELYVCNLPRSCDIAELVEIFKPYGTVISVEVSKNPETGISRGCGFVTMGSMTSAKNAIAALDGSDVGGREMRVKFSVDMSSSRRNVETQNSSPTKNIIYETPFKVYIGNLAWAVKPEELRNEFSKFGTVVSARVLYDRKAGKNRAYGFLSFSSAEESEAALSLNGKDYRGRVLIVRKGVERQE
ncbi:31 kDa ribonucleoprotein, chloroplastic [Mercurialis annua]|uniref:31 kDa ribonucleoprotein, chloroplastic n=1 Tax=Mercurialis annua TaxID=3986 RepID=UPI00215F51F2|nr:31 kDa ribonucleoprotein, chloroplastic [Mercurialis annua]XP_050237945.1 31 kDa ribonucleoprotein, chloroplastic [Mercurialis annua]